jgi:phosphomannomutase
MDDRSLAAPDEPAAYRCPGERHSIDRGVHLGRLAAFYPPCRDCVHRDDVQGLASVQVRQWQEIDARRGAGPHFAAEGLYGTSAGDLDGPLVGRFAGALAVTLWRDREDPAPPTVLVGADGHWTTAELVASACDALRLAGCRTVEAGAVTSASLAAAARSLATDAALLVGNTTGQGHAIALKVWGKAGRPWSSPGDLDRLRRCDESPIDRPKRRGGTSQRASADAIYLAPFEQLFHGLRPLRFVLDTLCEPLARYLDRLNSHAACEVLRPRGSKAGTSAPRADKPFVERRLELLGGHVLDHAAHFGMWISGDGEQCHLVDQRGAPVDSEAFFLMLATYVCRQQPNSTLVLENDGSARLVRAVKCLATSVVLCDSTRQAASDAIQSAGAVFGGGPSGRFWYGGDAVSADALLTLSLLLTILSHSDRALSEVLDAA